LICYEVIFPGEVVDPGDRPGWLVNVTNDAWYGDSSGPYQHFASARARAVEQGLPLARAANTGISGVIDPYGRVIARLGLGRAGVIDAALPRALPDATIYQRFGGGILSVLLLAGLAAAAASRWRGRV
jgi:apolipoprotein N-acyltransferase